MIQLTDTQKSLLMSNAKKDWLFNIYDDDTCILTIPTSKMVDDSLTIKEALCTAEAIDFSACEANTLSVKVADIDDCNIKGKKLIVSLSAGDISSSFTLPMGVYYVDSVEKINGTWFSKITAYDSMILFDVDVSDWYNNLEFPLTLYQFRCSLCEYIGVEQTDITLACDALQITKTVSPTELKGRDVLKAICQICGVFGHFNRSGILTYIALNNSPVLTLSDSGENHYKSGATHENWSVPAYDSVIVKTTDNDMGIEYPENAGTNTLTIVNNFLTYDMGTTEREIIATSVYDKIHDHSYTVHTTPTQGRIWLEVGDAIAVNTDEGDFNTYILERTLTGFQGINDIYAARGSETSESVFSVSKEIEKLKLRESVYERNVEHSLSRISDLERGLTEVEQDAGKVSVTVRTATGTLSTIIDGTSWGAKFTDNNNNVISGLTFDFVNSQFVFNGAGRFSGEINVADKFTVNTDGDVTMLGNAYIYGGRYYANSDSGYLDMGDTGINISSSDGVQRIKVGFTENQSDAPYILLNSGDGNHDTPGLFKKFANGLWIGNWRPIEEIGDFVAKTGYQGIFISFMEFKTYVVSDTVMKEIYTGEAIAKFG